MEVLVYKQHIKDLKHNVEFDKYKLTYKGKTFDLILRKGVKDRFINETKNMEAPYEVELLDDDYSPRAERYTRNDGTKGVKTVIFLRNYQSIKQGKFKSKTLDELVETYKQALGDEDSDSADIIDNDDALPY